MRYSATFTRFFALLSATISISLLQPEIAAAQCPCDIYAAGGTPCVAAHSMVRALYSTYNGPLYQVRRTADGALKNIGVLTAGGVANAAAQDSFLAGKAGTISEIYDQSPNANHLVRSPIGGWLYSPATESNATDTSIMMNGHKVYGLCTRRNMGYRNNVTTGVVTGNKAEGMYMVGSGRSVNDSCCYDYGNVETDMKDDGTGTMETINLSKECWFTPCTGTGPWVLADLENGLFAGGPTGHNTKNTSVAYDYVTAIVKGNSTNSALLAGTSGGAQYVSVNAAALSTDATFYVNGNGKFQGTLLTTGDVTLGTTQAPANLTVNGGALINGSGGAGVPFLVLGSSSATLFSTLATTVTVGGTVCNISSTTTNIVGIVNIASTAMKITGIPSSNVGLPVGGIYKDTNGFLRIVLA